MFNAFGAIVAISVISISKAKEAPSYSMDFLPETSFTCEGKSNGGFYADVETDCQLYHVCSRDKHGLLEDTMFLCGNGTVFDQRRLVCQDFRRVRCSNAPRYYRLPSHLPAQPKIRQRTADDDVRIYEAPNYSMEFLPETSFTCEGKRNGGYYADMETDCQMYHVCARNEDGILESSKFLCPNGTVFEQRKLVCLDFRKARCRSSPRFYRLSSILLGEPKRRISEDHLANIEAPSYSMEFLPETSFTCQGKTNGGYYADVEADCQLYHVCSRNKDGILDDTKFLCGNGTVFDQRKLVCENFRRVRCQDSPQYYRNSATLLEELEKRRRSEEDDRKIFKDADVDLRRIE